MKIKFQNNWNSYVGSKELAEIVADITGDGHLQLSGHRGQVSFYSNHDYELKRIKKLFKKLFNVDHKIYPDKLPG